MKRAARLGAIPLVLVVMGAYSLWVWDCISMPFDDALWYRRFCDTHPLQWKSPETYSVCVDLPAMNRWVYGALLRVFRANRLPCKFPDYSKSQHWNLAHGSQAPHKAEMIIRGFNLWLFWVTCLVLWLTLRLLVKDGFALLITAVLLCLPYQPDLIARFHTEGLLLFFLVATLALWAHLHKSGAATSRRGVLAIAVICGLAASTKINGTLVLFAFMSYLVVESSGFGKLVNPLMAAACAFAVFCVVNPVCIGVGPVKVCADMLHRRFEAIGQLRRFELRISKWEFYLRLLPLWWAMPPFFFAIWRRRKVRLLAPFIYWGMWLFIGTVLTISYPHGKYLAPGVLGLVIPGAAALAMIAQRLPAVDQESPPHEQVKAT